MLSATQAFPRRRSLSHQGDGQACQEAQGEGGQALCCLAVFEFFGVSGSVGQERKRHININLFGQ